MSTIKAIQSYVKQEYGFVPKSCWIAHVKELKGISVRRAWNRQSDIRMVPCLSEKRDAIENALSHFGLISEE